jgi:hypothetical protein
VGAGIDIRCNFEESSGGDRRDAWLEVQCFRGLHNF